VTEFDIVAVTNQSGQAKWVQNYGEEIRDCREGFFKLNFTFFVALERLACVGFIPS